MDFSLQVFTPALAKGLTLGLFALPLFAQPLDATATELAQMSSQAHVQPSQLTIFKQNLGLHFPANWRLAYSEQRGDMFSAEFVPAQELLAHWSSLYCVQGFKGMAQRIDPEAFLDGFAEQYRHTCEGEMQYQKLGASELGGKASYSAMLTCDKMPQTHRGEPGIDKPVGEIGHYTVIAGKEDLFLLHQSARGEALLSLSSLKIAPPVERIADMSGLR
ncbi:hypothetical protein K0I63_15530 [Shewanella rhizosphaerae]|uniref:hypothetical protein n=1 Tax=Shewanella rhizosphaerae TaxID=2864207 RepID=UPI001C661E1F|nr:hypothetical protein [Shewanella rhizosphaerae]QYK12139.1 hypothetical protein K0I63_15530 [Shewanella rhizosphaerae]